jgi:hypothetical protein
MEIGSNRWRAIVLSRSGGELLDNNAVSRG